VAGRIGLRPPKGSPYRKSRINGALGTGVDINEEAAARFPGRGDLESGQEKRRDVCQAIIFRVFRSKR